MDARALEALEAKIKPGSWVVIKPNIGSLPMRQSYAPGDVTDMRVTRAVFGVRRRKIARGPRHSGRGGTYRRVGDPDPTDSMRQNGVPVDGLTYDWTGQFAGFRAAWPTCFATWGAALSRQEIRLRRPLLRPAGAMKPASFDG